MNNLIKEFKVVQASLGQTVEQKIPFWLPIIWPLHHNHDDEFSGEHSFDLELLQ